MRTAVLYILAAVAALSITGCGSSGSSGDPVLTVYLSAPLSGPTADDGQDIADGAELALADAGETAAGAAVRIEVLDDADMSGWDPGLTGANARAATQDSSAIAYLGELDSGATRTSLPITNEAGLLQVSAGSGADDLTAEAIGGEQIPTGVQPSGVRTFGRVIPSDVRQGEAAGEWMGEMGIETVAVSATDGAFADALLAGLESSSSAPQVVDDEKGADATYFTREDLVDAETNIIPTGSLPIFGSDAQIDPDDLAGLRILTEACQVRTDCPGSPREIRLTSAALAPSQLPVEADDFLSDFEAAYDREAGRYAAYGYEAMAVILDSIERAEDPLDRGDVIDAFLATAERESILGGYSIDDVGGTTLAQLGAYRVVDGRLEPEPEPLELP